MSPHRILYNLMCKKSSRVLGLKSAPGVTIALARFKYTLKCNGSGTVQVTTTVDARFLVLAPTRADMAMQQKQSIMYM